MKDEQRSAIRHSVRIGRDLQNLFPEISDDFRSGFCLREIVERHNLSEVNGISMSTAKNAVRYSLGGYFSEFDFIGDKDYPGLIPLAEYIELAKKHSSDNLKNIGERLKEEGRGIYGLSDDERRSNSQEGARTQIRERIGIHAQTVKDRRKVGSMGAEKAGFTIWSDDEKSYVSGALRSSGKEYTRGSRVAIGKIARELNKNYHNGEVVRTSKAVGKFIADSRKGLRK